ncbi:MAG: hypothetical protein AB7E37_02940 [Candidatus Altimarinota bacterium]
MIFKALNIQPIQTVNWKEGYIQVGSNLGVFSKDEYLNFNYDEKSTRGWIFYYAYKSYLNKKVGVKKFEDEYTINYSQPFYEIGNLEYVGKTNDLKFIAREENKNKPFFDNQLVNSFNGPIGNSVTSSINYKGFDLEINGYIEEWYGNLNGVEAKDGKSIAFIIKDYSNFPIIYKKIVRIDKK